MAFGWFKKKKEEEENQEQYDSTNVPLNRLKKGTFIDYDLETYQVNGVFEYDWGDNYYADEFMLVSSDKTIYLYVEEGDGIECSIFEKININAIEGDIAEHIIETESPPRKIIYEGETYFRQSENLGHFRNADTEAWAEMVSWTYYDKSEEKILNIEQWGEEDFSASVGYYEDDFKFGNIIMP